MNETISSKKDNNVTIYSFPFNKSQYMFKDIKSKGANVKCLNLKQLMINQSNLSFKFFKPCSLLNNSLSSLLLKTRDQSKLSIDNKTNTSNVFPKNITHKNAYRRIQSRSKSNISNRKTTNQSNQQLKIIHADNNTLINKSCNINREEINCSNSNINEQIALSVNMSTQLSSLFHNKESGHKPSCTKQFPIINPKKKIQNIIPKQNDSFQLKSAEKILYQSYYSVDRTQKKRIVKYIKSMHQELLSEYGKDFTLVTNDKFSDSYQLKKKLVDFNPDLKHILLNEHILINNDILKQSINRELANQVKALNHNAKQTKYKRLKSIMIKAAIHIEKWGIPIEDFKKKKYSQVPEFTDEDFYLLLCAIKEMEYDKVDSYITMSRYLVLDCDYVCIDYIIIG